MDSIVFRKIIDISLNTNVLIRFQLFPCVAEVWAERRTKARSDFVRRSEELQTH
jgi:hypothetical protein